MQHISEIIDNVFNEIQIPKSNVVEDNRIEEHFRSKVTRELQQQVRSRNVRGYGRCEEEPGVAQFEETQEDRKRLAGLVR